MCAMLPPSAADAPPDFLVIGHLTRDLLPTGSWRLGGTATFAAWTAQRLGLRAAIVTSAPADLLAVAHDTLPGVAISASPAAHATTFENRYHGPTRVQYLRARATPLHIQQIPPAWRAAPLILLAPLAAELDATFISAFPGALTAATPQGWLRQWDATGLVSPTPLPPPISAALPHLRALILSREDIQPPTAHATTPLASPHPTATSSHPLTQADQQIATWAQQIALVVVTRGAEGAALIQSAAPPELLPGYPAHELDPTGAGDVFAAAFLCELHTTNDPRAAVDFANQVAAHSVEGLGLSAIPTRADLTPHPITAPPRAE